MASMQDAAKAVEDCMNALIAAAQKGIHGKILTTYRRADGVSIGDYDWVVHTEFFDDLDEPIEVIEEIWLLTKSETIMFGETKDDNGT